MAKIISVDLQNDFAKKGGISYQERACINFIENEMIPFLREKNIKLAEIVSDYRLPLLKSSKNKCVPGTRGYDSILTPDIKDKCVRVKSLHSPCWIRDNGGNSEKPPGAPYHAPSSFDKWLSSVGIDSKVDDEVVLLGLTLDCCVLCLAQELRRRGFNVFILEEGTDTYFGDTESKKEWLDKGIFYRAKKVTREQAKAMI